MNISWPGVACVLMGAWIIWFCVWNMFRWHLLGMEGIKLGTDWKVANSAALLLHILFPVGVLVLSIGLKLL